MLVQVQLFEHVVGGDHRALAARVRGGELGAQIQQQHRIDEGQGRAAQQDGSLQLAGIGLAGEGDPVVGIQDQFQEQIGQA